MFCERIKAASEVADVAELERVKSDVEEELKKRRGLGEHRKDCGCSTHRRIEVETDRCLCRHHKHIHSGPCFAVVDGQPCGCRSFRPEMKRLEANE